MFSKVRVRDCRKRAAGSERDSQIPGQSPAPFWWKRGMAGFPDSSSWMCCRRLWCQHKSENWTHTRSKSMCRNGSDISHLSHSSCAVTSFTRAYKTGNVKRSRRSPDEWQEWREDLIIHNGEEYGLLQNLYNVISIFCRLTHANAQSFESTVQMNLSGEGTEFWMW